MPKDEKKDEARRVVAQVRRLQSDIGRGLYEIGRLLHDARADKLYLAEGHASFPAWVEARMDLAPSSAYRAIDVYLHYSPAIAARYGPEKLEAGVGWLRATPERERPGDLVAAKLRLRGEGGKFVHKSFHDATASEVWDAVALLEEAKQGRSRIPRALRERVEAFAQKLPPGPKGVRSRARIRLLRDGRTGGLYVTFAAIPLDGLDRFGAVVRELRETVEDRG